MLGIRSIGGKKAGCDQSTTSPVWAGSTCGFVRALSGTLIVVCRSTSSQPSDDFNEFLPLHETMLELVLLGSFHPHILASSCIAPSLLGSSILPLFAS